MINPIIISHHSVRTHDIFDFSFAGLYYPMYLQFLLNKCDLWFCVFISVVLGKSVLRKLKYLCRFLNKMNTDISVDLVENATFINSLERES